MSLVRIKARARIGVAGFDLEVGDEADLPLATAQILGGNVEILGPAEAQPSRGADGIEGAQNRMQKAARAR